MKRALGVCAVLLLLVVAWRLLATPAAGADSGADVLRPTLRTSPSVSLPDAADVRRPPGPPPADPAAPRALLDTGSLTVQPPPGVHFILPARVELTRPADDWSGVRMLSHDQPGLWRDLPAGSYRLRVDGSAWAPQPATLELQGGESRVVELQPLSLMAGSVLGARSGAPVPHFSVALRVERAGDELLLHASLDIHDPQGHFALGGLDLGDQPAVQQVQLSVRTGYTELEPLRLQPPHDASWTQLLVQAPETAVTGRILLAGASPDTHVTAQVALFDSDASWREVWLDAEGRASLAPGTDAQTLRSEGAATAIDGTFAIPLLDTPARPVRLLATSDGWLPRLSESFALRPGGAPVAVDLELERAGRLEGRVLRASATPDAEQVPARLLEAYVQPLGETADRAPARTHAWRRQSLVDGDDAHLVFASLAPGEYELAVMVLTPRLAEPDEEGSGLLPFQATVRVQAGETTHVTLGDGALDGDR